MQIYLVGGAVRDGLLGLPVYERDYVIVGSDATQLLAQGFRPLNLAFPVFRHPESGAEYALARRERKVGIGYRGFVVETGPDVTIEEDLARRDLTINAIAQDAAGHIIDPFQGRVDLQSRSLRHITPAFQEDPVRLLRIARFAARFWHLGFRIAPATLELLRVMATQEELVSLFPQRFREELFKALATESPWVFFQVLQHCGALQVLLPILATAMDTDVGAPIAEKFPQSMTALHRATAASQDITIRFAALLGAVLTSPTDAAELCRNLKVERTLTDLLIGIVTWPAVRVAQATADTLLELLATRHLLHRPEGIEPLVQVWAALDPATGIVARDRLVSAVQAAASIRTEELRSQGLTGPALGSALRHQRLLAIVNAL